MEGIAYHNWPPLICVSQVRQQGLGSSVLGQGYLQFSFRIFSFISVSHPHRAFFSDLPETTETKVKRCQIQLILPEVSQAWQQGQARFLWDALSLGWGGILSPFQCSRSYS